MGLERRKAGEAGATFSLERRDASNCVIVRLAGPLRLGHRDAATGLQLVEYVRHLANEGHRRVAVDLSGLVRAPDSSGLGELVAAESSLRRCGGRLVLVSIPEKLRELIEMLRLGPLFRIVRSEDEAVALFDEDAPSQP